MRLDTDPRRSSTNKSDEIQREIVAVHPTLLGGNPAEQESGVFSSTSLIEGLVVGHSSINCWSFVVNMRWCASNKHKEQHMDDPGSCHQWADNPVQLMTTLISRCQCGAVRSAIHWFVGTVKAIIPTVSQFLFTTTGGKPDV